MENFKQLVFFSFCVVIVMFSLFSPLVFIEIYKINKQVELCHLDNKPKERELD